jgi:selenocysteine lyase/cysteine desulfurase
MKLTRRACLLGGVAATAALLPLDRRAQAEEPADSPKFDPADPLPHKAAFFPFEGTYLNSGSQHPLSRGARAALEAYLDYKTLSSSDEYSIYGVRNRVIDAYARLINADKEAIAFVPSTTAGENLVVGALDIPRRGGRIVTDALHFFGSFPLYAELRKRGMDVVTLRSRDGAIDMDEFEAAVTDETRLVSVSSVSTFNGFRHDLKRICEIAHAKDARVYADVIHSVGAVPFDVRASGVDFCSSSAYKWLMGDMGLGFLYVRPDRLGELVRPWYGYHQVTRFQSHVFPGDPPGDSVADYDLGETANGYFAMGTTANTVVAELEHSLRYLQDTGVARIQAHRQPLIDRLQEALPPMGYAPLTPAGTNSPLVSFALKGPRDELNERLERAGVSISVTRNHFRISPSVFNDLNDIEKLIEVLA